MILKIDHIGIAVRSLIESIPFYEKTLGLKCDKIEEILSQKVKIALFQIGEIHIELLEPTSDSSTIFKFIAKNGEGVHHIAYKTDDLQKELNNAKSNGCALINEVPIEGSNGKSIAFLHPNSTHGVLTEFC